MCTEKEIINLVAHTFSLDTNRLSLSSTQGEIEQWDSLGHLQLIMAVESEFNIKFKASEISEINNLKVLTEKIQQHSLIKS